MSRAAAIAAVAVMVGAVLHFTRTDKGATSTSTPEAASNAPTVADEVNNSVMEMVDTVRSTYNNLTTDPRNALTDANVIAFLKLIRVGEGTPDQAGYSRLFGGKQFASFADHPRIYVPFGSTTSSAAGAYQILARTWDEMRAKYELPDFSPASQDVAAVGLIKRRGALGDVIAGRFKTAIEKCNNEWASLPGSPYGQPTLTMSRAAGILAGLGAQSTEAFA